jgi:hypothetical protein
MNKTLFFYSPMKLWCFCLFLFEITRAKRHHIGVQRLSLSCLLAAILFLAAALNLSAQGNAISYQGQLYVSGALANTNYDFRFAVFDAPTNGNQISVYVTNSAVPVTNGLFSVKLNFGPGVFNGTDNGSNDWMDIGVRAIGVTAFTSLVPRQPILPVPYALFATSASNLLGSLQSTQIVGTISAALLSGTYTNAVNFINGSNTFNGAFSGNGVGLTNLNASQLLTGTVSDARLQPDVALLDQTQTFTAPNTFSTTVTFNGSDSFTGPNLFSGANTFSGVNTFSNNANYFQGNFFGNGLVGWNSVSGTSVTAARDNGYMLTSSSLTSLTLPASGSLTPDDIVRVSGAGAGGWLVKGNSGESIVGNFAAYKNCFVATIAGSPTANGYGFAASADGVRMYAVGGDIAGVYASSDSGQTWNQVSGTLLSGNWNSVACSANGRIVYVQPTSGTIQKSVNNGATWTSTGTGATGQGIACTADGSTLITGTTGNACSGNGTYRARVSGGAVQYSSNSGGTWTSVAALPAGTAFCVGASSDCTRLVAGVSNGLLYASSNLGASWTTLTISNQLWSSVWMSPDGSKLGASTSQNAGAGGGIYSGSVSAQPNTATTATTGSLCGSQGSAVELQYIGGSQFIPVSSSGLLWAN